MRGRTAKRALVATVFAGILASAVGLTTQSAWVSATDNQANSVSTGTVALGDNDGGSSAMFTLTGQRPGDTDTGCIAVTANGTLDADVRLYGTTAGAGAAHLGLTVTRGTFPATPPAFDSCTGFAADAATHVPGQAAGVLYAGTLAGFPDDWAGGVADPEPWTTGMTRAYRFQLTTGPNRAAEGATTTQTFTWEARNR